MTFLKKLKTFVKKDTATQTDPTQAHLSPISERIETWIKDKGWKYDHIPPDDDDELRTHHFTIGFRNENEYLWNCLIRIHEKNQLISLQGLPVIDVDKTYYLAIITVFTAINCSIGIGSFELDVTTGTIRTKIGFDGEFTMLSDHALNSYLQGLASLTEKAYEIVNAILKDPDPHQNLLTLLQEQGAFDSDIETDTAGNPYFVPTHIAQ